MPDHGHDRSLAGVGSLATIEIRRWLPRRAGLLAIVSFPALVLVSFMFRGEADTPFGEILSVTLAGWSIVLVILTIATGQGVLAAEVENGTAAWTVAMPVTRRAYVVGKFLGAAPTMAVAAVVVPGLLAYPVLASAASAKSEFGAANVLDALNRDPGSYAGMPSLGEYLVMLSMIALLVVFLLAAMLLFGSRLTSTSALLGLGLATAGVLVVVAVAGVEEATPGVAFLVAVPGRLDELAVGVALLVSAAWSIGAVALATWSFERRPL